MSYERDAAVVCPPGSGGTITVPSGSSSTAGSGVLTAYKNHWLWMKSSSKAHVRFGTSAVGAATTGDIYLTPDADYHFRIPASVTHVRVRGVAAGTLYYRKSSGSF